MERVFMALKKAPILDFQNVGLAKVWQQTGHRKDELVNGRLNRK